MRLARNLAWRALVVLAALLPVSLALPATGARAAGVFTVYMSASGSDGNDGMAPDKGVYSLVRVQEVLREQKPTTDVEVRIGYGTYSAPYLHDWRFYVPGHTISFLPADWHVGDPAPAAGRPIFQNKKNASGVYPDGYWFQPRLPQDPADPLYNGGTSGLRFYYLQVQYYNAGGISIWGDSERDVDDENYDPPMYQQAGAGLNGNTIYGMLFTHLGSKWGGGHYGWGGVVLTNSSNNVMDNNQYVNIENGGSYGGYIHGAYITHFSSHNTVTNSKFNHVSSDAVKVRDRSNYNTVENNQFVSSGVNSYYRDEYCDRACAVANPGTERQCASYHNRFLNNDGVSGYSGGSIADWSLKPSGMTNAGGAPCTLPAGEQRLGPCLSVALSRTAYPPLQQGSTDEAAVCALQTLLKSAGQTVTVGGDFDAATRTAVSNFQTSAGVYGGATGTADNWTWTALLARGSSYPTLGNGSSGEAVTRVQRALTAALGSSLAQDGQFGSLTTTAVKSYQTAYAPPADGSVGSDTWGHLKTGR